MVKRLGLPLLAVLAVCSFALNAADSEIEQLKQMIKAQNAKIEKLERTQGASQASASVDKAIGSKGACYLAPDRPNIEGVGLSFTGEYLYWKSTATENTYAFLGGVDAVGDPANLGHAKDINTDWSHGFRLGLDYKLPYDGWNIGADYTYYRADGEDSVTVTAADNAAGTYLYPAFVYNATGMPPAVVFGHAKSTADLDFDRVNFEIGRNTKISETLSVRFFGGASVIWVDAKTQQSFYDTTAPVLGLGYHHTASAEANYYGIRAGLDAEMKLKYGFSLLGKAAGAMLVGDLETSTIAGLDANADGVLARNETSGNTKNSAYRVVPGLELEAGVAWERKILDGLNLKVFLGYQFSDYIGAMERLEADYPANGTWNGNNRVVNRESDLVLHGVVFRLKLDF